MKNNKQFRCEAHGDHGNIFLYGTIGGDWFGGVTAEEVAADVTALGDLKSLSIHVNSYGGDVFDGIAIRAIFMKSPAEKEVFIDGIAASAATVAVALPDVPITIADGARYMIHNPWGIAVGESSEMRKTADLLDSVRGDLISIYEARTHDLSREDIGQMMDEETWMSAQDAVDFGFASSMGEELAIAAWVPDKIADKLKHVPEELVAETEVIPMQTTTVENDNVEEVILHDGQRFARLQESRVKLARAMAQTK